MSGRDFHAEAQRILAGTTALLPQVEHLRAVADTASWIPVDERLPDDDITVMIATSAADEPVWLGFHDDQGWHSVDATPLGGMVTHWRPMPEGPRGG